MLVIVRDFLLNIPLRFKYSGKWWATKALRLSAAMVLILCLFAVEFRLGNSNWVIASRMGGLFGYDSIAPIHIVRLGPILLLGLPVELNAEIGMSLKEEISEAYGIAPWFVSMNTAYYGYVSPDALYEARDRRGNRLYESGLMAFLGPHAEYYFRELLPYTAARARESDFIDPTQERGPANEQIQPIRKPCAH